MQPYLLIYLHRRPYTGICLYTIIALTISDTFRIRDFMNYSFLTGYDAQSTHEISDRFGSTDSQTISCGFQRPIGQSYRDTSEGEMVRNWQRQSAEATRLGKNTQLRLTVPDTIPSSFRSPSARRSVSEHATQGQFQWFLNTITPSPPNAWSMRSDKLPPTWVNWRLQGRFPSPYVAESRITCNAKVAHTLEIPSNLVRQAQLHAKYHDDTGQNWIRKCTYIYIALSWAKLRRV